MRRAARRVPDEAVWVDGDFYLHISSTPVRIEAGSRQCVIPCVVCDTPAGGQECFLLCLVAGLPCPKDNSHLGGLGCFCHVRCLPRSEKVLINAVAAVLSRAGH